MKYRNLPLSYDPARVAFLPELSAERVLRTTDLEAASEKLLSWAVQRSTFRVVATDTPLQQGSVVEMSVGIGKLALRFGCRVVDYVHEPTYRSFTYGTLPGHVERGEEKFSLRQAPDGTITFSIVVHSEPATWWLKIARPILDAFRTVVLNTRYLKAVE
ncbi:DUF1990 family protein [Corynebacterium lubricantis]|uniref:DUF1990 family protein n=1 Tax=Corynebacterium lubricantis TaxID=541095 RepID=UPI0003778625|nr:DUF1990 domain-containing protein [Corynebacterium lubricantis]